MRRTTSHPQRQSCRICGGKVLAKGLCSKHYQRAWRGEDPTAYSVKDPNPIRVGKKFAYVGVLDREGQTVAETVIDLADLEAVRQFKWTVAGQGRYICCSKAPGRYLHRFLLKAPANRQVDHINGKVWDNRRSNLRLATVKLNNRNSKKSRKGDNHRRGVWWKEKQGSWSANTSLYFDTKREAVAQRELWEWLCDQEIYSKKDFLEGIAGWRTEDPA